MTTQPAPRARFTGWHFTLIMIAFFGVVIVVNVGMARIASRSFTGVVVENGYVASQSFNRWLDAAARDRAMGWSAVAHRQADGHVVLNLAGAPAGTRISAAHAIQPLDGKADRALAFTPAADGSFGSAQALPAGRWRLLIEAEGRGQTWHGEVPLQ